MAKQHQKNERQIIPVILLGGSDKRLWPLARLGNPQPLRLAMGGRSPFLESIIRLRSWMPRAERPIIVTTQEQLPIVREQLDSIQLKPLAIVLESQARKTGPAVIAAAVVAERLRPGSILVVSPSDQIIRDNTCIAESLGTAMAAAAAGDLVVFGLTEHDGNSGASYLLTSETSREDGLERLERFIEGEPGRDGPAAAGNGTLLMNSGIYCFAADALLAEAARRAPTLLTGCQGAIDRATHDDDVFHLRASDYDALPSLSLGAAILDRSTRTLASPLKLRWSDLGSWDALWDLGLRDDDDNVCLGDSHVIDCHGVYARSEGPLMAAYGVDNLVVVATPEAVLVARRDDRESVRKIHDHLAASGRSDVPGKRLRREAWGWVETIEQGPYYALRRLVVHPGCTLPVERHHQHGETLTVISGIAHLWIDGELRALRENDSVAVPLRSLHTLHNPGRRRLELIEVQTGNVTGDDDCIVVDDRWVACKKLPRPCRVAAETDNACALPAAEILPPLVGYTEHRPGNMDGLGI